VARLAKRSDRRQSLPRLGALPPRYSFVLNPDLRAKFTKCPRCNAQTRLRKLPLLIHVEHPAGARLAILGKTCRLCLVCEILIAHDADISRLLVASGLAAEGGNPSYVVLGTVAPPVWRAGLTRGVTLDTVRAYAADFKQYMRIDVTPGGWYRDEAVADDDITNTGAASRRPQRRKS
jgi:hypothetical protein